MKIWKILFAVAALTGMVQAANAVDFPLPPELVPYADTTEVQAGFLPARYYTGVDPTGTTLSTTGLNNALADGILYGLVVLLDPGVYMVDDTIIGEQVYQSWGCADHLGHEVDPSTVFTNPEWSLKTMRRAPMLAGSPVGNRPKIVLADSSAGFGDKLNPKAVIHFFNNGPGYSGDPEWQGKADCGMSFVLRDIDIDIGRGNVGAIGVRFPSAQHSTLQDIKVDASAGGYAGFQAIVQTGASVNLEVVGGDYGVIFEKGGETLAGAVLTDQAEAAILVRGGAPTTVIGAQILKRSGPAVVQSYPWQNHALSMIESRITLLRGGEAFNNSDGSSLFLSDVYVRGADTLVRSASNTLSPASGNWSKIDQYAYSDPKSANGITAINWIDGATTTGVPDATVTSAQNAPNNFVVKNTWSLYPWYSFASNVKDFGAVGDGVADDTSAIQAAINSGGWVFLPRGDYKLSAPLVLGSDTVLFGPPGDRARLLGWQTTAFDYMVDAPVGSPVIADIRLLIPSGSRTLGAVRWVGDASSWACNVESALGWEYSNYSGEPRRILDMEGGGRWFSTFHNNVFWETATDHPDHRTLLVHNSAPVTFYGFNSEYAFSPIVEFSLAADARILGFKTEVSDSAVILGDSTNIQVLGIGGHCYNGVDASGSLVKCDGTQVDLVVLQGSNSNVALGNTTLYASSHQPLSMIKSNGVVDVPADKNAAIYQIGQFDGTAF